MARVAGGWWLIHTAVCFTMGSQPQAAEAGHAAAPGGSSCKGSVPLEGSVLLEELVQRMPDKLFHSC